MKKLLLLSLTMILSLNGFAQEAVRKSFIDDPLLPVYIIIGIIIFIIILLIGVAIVLLKTINSLTAQAAKEKAARLGVAYVPTATWWDRFSQRVNASVPVEQEKNIEMDHNYDGIKELDNHLPPWWKWLFYGTIGWSIVYIIAFHVSNSLPLSEQEYHNEVALAEEKARQLRASQPEVAIDETTLVFTQDASIIEKGKSIFNEYNCGSCHRNDGGGNTIGPNLTDEYWLRVAFKIFIEP
jgi:cytochrome c oxidase cbb3-type subunit 3